MAHYILQIDTASLTTSLSLCLDGDVISDRIYKNNREQALFLIPEIQSILSEHHSTVADLHEIRAMIGPGSFTGIRIGLAAAQGLAFGRDIALSGISNFNAYRQVFDCHATETSTRYLLIALESYRKELFFQLIDLTRNHVIATKNCVDGEIYDIMKQHHIDEKDMTIIGDATDKIAETFAAARIIPDATLANDRSIGSFLHYCPAKAMTEMAPYYMRPADAVKAKNIRKICITEK